MLLFWYLDNTIRWMLQPPLSKIRLCPWPSNIFWCFYVCFLLLFCLLVLFCWSFCLVLCVFIFLLVFFGCEECVLCLKIKTNQFWMCFCSGKILGSMLSAQLPRAERSFPQGFCSYCCCTNLCSLAEHLAWNKSCRWSSLSLQQMGEVRETRSKENKYLG